MRCMKIVFALVFLQSSFLCAEKIVMKINPHSTFDVGVPGRPIDGMEVFMEGNFQKYPVRLISSKSKFYFQHILETPKNALTWKDYVPERWEEDLKNGLSTRYPLFLHKQFMDLPDDVELQIVIYNAGSDSYDTIPLSDTILKKILNYLKQDLESRDLDCSNFVNAIRFDYKDRVEMVESVSTTDCYEEDIRFGDPIIFYETGDEFHVVAKHFLLAIGNDLYVSKQGKGGPIVVTKFEPIKKYWGCSYTGIVQEDLANDTDE